VGAIFGLKPLKRTWLTTTCLALPCRPVINLATCRYGTALLPPTNYTSAVPDYRVLHQNNVSVVASGRCVVREFKQLSKTAFNLHLTLQLLLVSTPNYYTTTSSVLTTNDQRLSTADIFHMRSFLFNRFGLNTHETTNVTSGGLVCLHIQ
jgi:hypothetical protein